MSTTNGHGLPEGATIATLDLLRQANTTLVKAPALSARAGRDVYVRIRAIRRATYLLMLPPPPPGSEEWASDPALDRPARLAARMAAYVAWLASLSPDERQARQAAEDAVTYRLLVAGMVEPAVTPATAYDWADDADVIAAEILRFSGLIESERPERAATEEAAGAHSAPAAV